MPPAARIAHLLSDPSPFVRMIQASLKTLFRKSFDYGLGEKRGCGGAVSVAHCDMRAAAEGVSMNSPAAGGHAVKINMIQRAAAALRLKKLFEAPVIREKTSLKQGPQGLWRKRRRGHNISFCGLPPVNAPRRLF